MTARLTTLSAAASTDQIQEVMLRDGACILENAMGDELRQAIIDETSPYVEMTRFGGDDFSGRETKRTGALVARCPSTHKAVMDEIVLGCAQRFLSPYTEKILLHLTQTIFIGPGQGAQMFHRDRQAWGAHFPTNIEPQFNTLWALSDFTNENGATRVVPGSQSWPLDRTALPEETCQAEMRAGSVLLYSGSVIHSGGENRTDETRMGLNITYCLGWLRQEENQFLSCPPHIAKDLPQDLQALLGYTMGNYALGYFSDPDMSLERGAGILPPERAVGTAPTKPGITQ